MKLKRLLAAALLAGLCPALSRAEYLLPNPELYVGVSGGATYCTTTMVPLYVDKTYKLGMDGGLVFRCITEKNFGIEVDLNYFQSGWADDYGYLQTDVYERRVDYVELPFLMHARIGKKAARFFLNAGPKFAWFVQESETISSSYMAEEVPYYGKAVETYFQWGVLGGLGFEVHMGPTVLGLEGRYYYGLSDMFSNAVTDPFVNSSLQQISLNLFFLFQVK